MQFTRGAFFEKTAPLDPLKKLLIKKRVPHWWQKMQPFFKVMRLKGCKVQEVKI